MGLVVWQRYSRHACQGIFRRRRRRKVCPFAAAHSEWKRACAFYRWAVRVVADWQIDTQVSVALAGRKVGSNIDEPAAQPTKPKAVSHGIWRNATSGWCRLCGTQAPRRSAKRPAAFTRPCRGTMGAGRALAVSLAKRPFDDGAIPIAVLRSQMAEKGIHRTTH